MRVKKGDRVIVRSGKYKGREANVVRAMPSDGKVVLDGVNIAKRHSKPTARTYQGGIIDKFMPLPVSSVSIVCPSCGEPTRVGMQVDDQGRKLRVCKKCGAEL
ncbi:MAG: 50S ribosomal protein L24 [Acidimicrobiales bacterium]